MAQGLVPESGTVAPAGNWDALSGQQVCRAQGSGPCVACQAQPCYHLQTSVTDLTRVLDFELDPSVWLPQGALNAVRLKTGLGPLGHLDTEIISLTLEIRDAGLPGAFRRSLFGG